jgi:hypothetical protein
VGRSTPDAAKWQNPPPQNGNFTITYNAAEPGGYRATFGGGNHVALATLLEPDAGFVVDDWRGLAQPSTLTAKDMSGGAAQPAPGDYRIDYSHAHQTWTGIDANTGEPKGKASGKHSHSANLVETFVSADDANGVMWWYVQHKH